MLYNAKTYKLKKPLCNTSDSFVPAVVVDSINYSKSPSTTNAYHSD